MLTYKVLLIEGLEVLAVVYSLKHTYLHKVNINVCYLLSKDGY